MTVQYTLIGSVGDWYKRVKPELEANGFKRVGDTYKWRLKHVYPKCNVDWQAIMAAIVETQTHVVVEMIV